MKRSRLSREGIAPGDMACVHDPPHRKIGWTGLVHGIEIRKGQRVFRVSQYWRDARNSVFTLNRAIVFPTIWTFNGRVCLHCKVFHR